MEKRGKRVYLDSNVFISLFNEEIGAGLRGLFAEAESFFDRIKEDKHVLVLSEVFFREVERKTFLPKGGVLGFLNDRQIIVECVEEGEKFPIKKFLDAGLHFSDALHAALATRHNCDCIVTFNLKDFLLANNKILVFTPADFT